MKDFLHSVLRPEGMRLALHLHAPAGRGRQTKVGDTRQPPLPSALRRRRQSSDQCDSHGAVDANARLPPDPRYAGCGPDSPAVAVRVVRTACDSGVSQGTPPLASPEVCTMPRLGRKQGLAGNDDTTPPPTENLVPVTQTANPPPPSLPIVYCVCTRDGSRGEGGGRRGGGLPSGARGRLELTAPVAPRLTQGPLRMAAGGDDSRLSGACYNPACACVASFRRPGGRPGTQRWRMGRLNSQPLNGGGWAV